MSIVSGLNVYPVKGMRRVPLTEAVVEKRGLRGDRRWVVTDFDGKSVTQRDFPQLATYEVSLIGEHLQIKHDENGLAMIPTHTTPTKPVLIWKDTVEAVDAGIMASLWLSKALNSPVRLFYMPETSLRTTDADFSQPGDCVSFADGFPILVSNEASLEDLNSRLAEPVPMERFRPNIVVSGFVALAEDNWTRLRISDVEFKAAKPCGRCIVTTIDQDTGERKGEEPLATLARYRLIGKAAVFGMNLIPCGDGVIRLGDPVEVML